MKFTHHPFSSVLIAVAVWLSLLPLAPLIEPLAHSIESVPLLAAAALIGLILTRMRAPRVLTLVAQVIALLGVLLWRGLTLAGPGDPAGSLRTLTLDGIEAIRSQAAPLTATPGTIWLCLLLVTLLIIVVELLVNVLEQPGWSIAPLALSFGISAVILRDDLPFFDLVPVIGAYTIVLLSVAGVGPTTGRASRQSPFHISRVLTGLGLASIAVAVSLLVSPLVPLGPKQPWNSGTDGPIQLSDPLVRLDQDLRRPADTPVLTYRPSTGEPIYLRTVALSSVTADGARLVPMQLNRFGLRDLDAPPGTEVTVETQMADVPSEYLPVPFAVTDIDAAGLWSYDPATLTVVAAGEDRTEQTRNLSYTAQAVMPDPSREQIEAAEAGSGLDPVLSEVPSELSPEVATLTADVVGDAVTAGQQALAIQSFLRSDEFTYSLDAPSSAGSSVIDAFLLSDRSGYCIHFATAMITMARIQGIPARMAVGFTPGDSLEDGSFEVTSHDAHAWPELFLDGLGWVPFEPTPAFAGNPGYTDPAAQPSAEPSQEPSPSVPPASSQPTVTPPSPTATPTAPATSSGGGGAGLGIGLGIVLLIGLAFAPALVRLGQRRVRLRGGVSSAEAADGAWNETLATLRDHGMTWPGGSPVPGALALSEDLPDEAAKTLAGIAHTVELSRYAREGAVTGGIAGQVRALRGTLWGVAPWGRRLRVTFVPPSVFTRSPRKGTHATSD